MPKNSFNKVSTLWTCQTYMENMSRVLKLEDMSFGVLFVWKKLRQFRTFLKLLPRDVLRHLRHWLQFGKLRTWIHDNVCYLPIKSDSIRNSCDVLSFPCHSVKTESDLFQNFPKCSDKVLKKNEHLQKFLVEKNILQSWFYGNLFQIHHAFSWHWPQHFYISSCRKAFLALLLKEEQLESLPKD